MLERIGAAAIEELWGAIPAEFRVPGTLPLPAPLAEYEIARRFEADAARNADAGRYTPDDYPDDGTTVNVNGGWGIPIGGGSLGLFGEFRDRQETNRAWADPFEDAGTGVADEINDKGQVIQKNNPVPQPNHHWGDGVEKDVLTFANFRLPVNTAGSSEVYAFGGYSHRDGTGNG